VKKSWKIILIIVVSIVVTAILVSYYLCIPLSDKITVGATIIGTLSTLATLIIALLLYDRFKIDQSILDRQGNKVIELWYLVREKSFRVKYPKGILFLDLAHFTDKDRMLTVFRTAEYFLAKESILLFSESYEMNIWKS
jgi:hypothetical protein